MLRSLTRQARVASARVSVAASSSRSLHVLSRARVVAAASAPAAASRLSVPVSAVCAASSTQRAMSTGSVTKVLDDEDLRSALSTAGSKLVVVDWYAEWCAPCRRIAPMLEELAGKTPEALFLKADIDTLEDASVEAGVQSVPTFHFIKDGQLVAEFSGADINKLRELVAEHK